MFRSWFFMLPPVVKGAVRWLPPAGYAPVILPLFLSAPHKARSRSENWHRLKNIFLLADSAFQARWAAML